MTLWRLEEAKTRLSEVMAEADSKEPQIITVHGMERAVLMSIRDYRTLTTHQPNLKEYLLAGPRVDDLSVMRERDVGRKVRL